jgi:uracil-DNA glycosylase family 4
LTAHSEPEPDCILCPRLVAFRRENEAGYPDFHNGPVVSFGDLSASMLVVGLAPGLKGANRTGRPFTGDGAGDLLYPGLVAAGFAIGSYDKRPDDGLKLVDCRITNAVRCVPPQNKVTGAEAATCRPFLIAEIDAMKRLQVMLALGRVAHEAILRTFGLRLKEYSFGHGVIHELPNGLLMADSFHCSRYNVNTGRLTAGMFGDVLTAVRQRLDAESGS